jgi:AAA15 family ATPase/GTPase
MSRFLVFDFSRKQYNGFNQEYHTHKDVYFNNYTLGATSLLPKYFGSIAPINIFLGENNSGKSRFMRDIMKVQNTSIYDVNFSFNELCEKGIELCSAIDNLPDILPKRIRLHLTGNINNFNEIDKLIGFPRNNNSSSHSIDLQAEFEFKNIRKIAEAIKDSIDYKSVLDLLTESINTRLQALNEHSKNIQRIINICTTLNRQDLWGNGELASNSDVRFHRYNLELNIFSLPNAVEYAQTIDVKELADLIRQNIGPILKLIHSIFELLKKAKKTEHVETNKVYIPVLRSGRKLINNEGYRLAEDSDILELTTINDYDLKVEKLSIKTGFTLYKDIDTMYKARIEIRNRLHSFEEFLSKSFFNGKLVIVVPEQEDGKNGGNILITVDNEERDIHHLGDGIQALILILFPLFMSDEGQWFFIEEPETHLHPGFQRLFIQTISSNQSLLNKNLIIFLTTHSNHIIDYAIDEAKTINLFTFRKTNFIDTEFIYNIQLSKPRDLSNLIELGVQNSSVFLSNCTIWVEGVTDRIYLSAYLKCLMDRQDSSVSLIEGLHYSFLEYAGANVAHYTFNEYSFDDTITSESLQKIKALSISNRIMLIADQDGGAKTKRDEQLSGEGHDGFVYLVLEVREIENLLSPEIIIKTLVSLYPKEENIFDAKILNSDEYKQNYLGSYLRSKFPMLPENFAPSNGSGTIGSAKKRRFAEEAAKALTSWDMLTQEAQRLTIQVFDFIIGHNPRLGNN